MLSSVTSVRLLTESGTRDYCLNWPLLVALNLFFVGLRVIYLGVVIKSCHKWSDIRLGLNLCLSPTRLNSGTTAFSYLYQ